MLSPDPSFSSSPTLLTNPSVPPAGFVFSGFAQICLAAKEHHHTAAYGLHEIPGYPPARLQPTRCALP